MQQKIDSLDTLAKKISHCKQNGQTVVFCHGLFHFLHIGHIRYLKQAKNYGDVLIVSLKADKFINKSETIEFDENLRAEAISSLDWIDSVIINPFEEVSELIERLRPDVFVRGFESKANNSKHKAEAEHAKVFFEKLGVEIVIAKEENFDSTLHINRYISNLPDDVQNYLRLFKQRFTMQALIEPLQSMKRLKVLVIGDTILDEYHYCTALGKSSKDPTLALKYESHDIFAGGVLAIANHTSGFASQVDLFTILGGKDSHEDFIRSKLMENVTPHFYFRPDSPTLIKRRFLDGYSMNKLLELYVMDESILDRKIEREINAQIREVVNEYDLVIVADFGHGAIGSDLKKLLSKSAPFLAVNAQSNAGNRGFNNITKYSRADYISMAEHEIRLEMRDLIGKVRPMMTELINNMKCRLITVTRGRRGCMLLDREDCFVQVPSFTKNAVDRIGAGDALFALTSLAAVQNVPCEIIGFLGNIMGTLAVEVMGNKTFINFDNVTDFIEKIHSDRDY